MSLLHAYPVLVFFPDRQELQKYTQKQAADAWTYYQNELGKFINLCLKKTSSQALILAEASCFDPQDIFMLFPEVSAVFASYFQQSKTTNKAECLYSQAFNQRPEASELKSFVADAVLNEHRLQLVESKLESFILPRTLSMIYLEAKLAEREGVANQLDIDRAMKFGVNYPAGPFEWLKEWEPEVKICLDQLYRRTQDARYYYPF
jgi:hypothetical protein